MTMARKWWTLTAVVIGVFMLLLDITIVNVALPDIQDAFHASLSDLQWVIDAYALTLAAGLLTAGSLADLFGRRLLFGIGTVIFTGGSLLCGLATGALFLSLARAGQGVGGAIMFATSLALLSDAFRGKDRGVAFGVFGAVTGIAVAIGPVLGGFLTTGISWRWIFLVNVPIGVVALVITALKVSESKNPAASRPDWFGFVTFSASLGLLVYGLISAGEDGWTTSKVLGCLIGAAVLMAIFLIGEARQRHPMLDLSLFRKPTFSGGLIAAFGMSASLFSLLTYVVLYLQKELGYSAKDTGLRLLVLSGAIFITAGIAGRLTTVVPIRLLIGGGFLFVGTGLLLMRGITPGSDWTHLIPGMIVAGVGAGLVNTPLASTAVGVVHPSRAGMASGINSTFRQVGIATGIAALGSLFSTKLRDTVVEQLNHTNLAARSHEIAATMGSAQGGTSLPKGVPAEAARTVGAAAKVGFVDGLNEILLIGAVVAFVAAAGSLLLIRARDFVEADGSHAPADRPEPATVGDNS